MGKLTGKTAIVTGASRGIGREMALRFARDGANIVVAAKSDSEGKLPGTIFSVAEEIKAVGAQALAIKTDVRSEESVAEMVTQTVERFGRIDILVNNAGAINLTPLTDLPPRRMDLMLDINLRAVLLCSHFCIPHLVKAGREGGAHILNLSPPITLKPKWLGPHVVYTISKFGMSLATIGLAEELRAAHIAVNSLWPRTLIATAAVQWLMGDPGMAISRTPLIMADAAFEIVTTDPTNLTGQCILDEKLLRERGATDFAKYSVVPGSEPALDLYVED